MHKPFVIGMTVIVLTLAACGNDTSGNGPRPAQQARAWDESQVMRLAGIETDDQGLSYRLAAHPDCTASVVMVSAAQVATYADAGDTVATNPDGTAGVKVSAAERATCTALFARALTRVQ